MPPIGPIKQSDLIKYLRQAGFTGPHPGRKHPFMVRGNLKLTIPNPHRGDISKGLLADILKQAQIDKDFWKSL